MSIWLQMAGAAKRVGRPPKVGRMICVCGKGARMVCSTGFVAKYCRDCKNRRAREWARRKSESVLNTGADQ